MNANTPRQELDDNPTVQDIARSWDQDYFDELDSEDY